MDAGERTDGGGPPVDDAMANDVPVGPPAEPALDDGLPADAGLPVDGGGAAAGAIEPAGCPTEGGGSTLGAAGVACEGPGAEDGRSSPREAMILSSVPQLDGDVV